MSRGFSGNSLCRALLIVKWVDPKACGATWSAGRVGKSLDGCWVRKNREGPKSWTWDGFRVL